LSLEALAELALRLAREVYGGGLMGLALRLLSPCIGNKCSAEVYVFIDELPLEEADYASRLLEAIPRDKYAEVAVLTYTAGALSRASEALRRALAEARVVYDRDGRLRELVG